MYDIIVLGSGISSACFLDALKIKNRKIGVISFKNNLSKNIEKDNYYNLKSLEKNLPPRFIKNKKNFSRVVEYFANNKINFSKDTSIFGILDHGGASNYWGSSCQFLLKKDIKFLNKYNQKKLIYSFNKIYKKFHFSGSYNNESKKTKKKKLNKTYNELIKYCSNDNVFFYENCTAEDLKNKTPFLPKNINNKLKDKFKYLNLYVDKICKNKNYYLLICKNGKNKVIIKTKKLVLASGTISSTRLICDMLNYTKKIYLDHNPMLFGVFLTKKTLAKEKFSASKIAAEIYSKKYRKYLTANFRGSNNIIKNKIFNNYFLMKNFLSNKMYNLISNKLFFVNLYLDSYFGNLIFKMSNTKKIYIYTDRNKLKRIKKELLNSFKLIYKILRDNNIVEPIKHQIIPKMGNDSHYTGTIPINGKNKKLSLNENCELINHKNLFIIDGCSIPKNPLKFPTGLIMANAYRIGNKF